MVRVLEIPEELKKRVLMFSNRVGGDLAEKLQLVGDAEQEGLVEHRGDEGRAEIVALDVEDDDAGPGGGGAQLFLQVFRRVADQFFHLVALLEIDVDDVVAAGLAVARQRLAVDVDPGHLGQFAGRRVEGAGQVAEAARAPFPGSGCAAAPAARQFVFGFFVHGA